MILISHRGNIDGPWPDKENDPEQIERALACGFNVEIDVWLTVQGWLLGHDAPEYKVDMGFLRMEGLWCHAKNVEALEGMIEEKIHCFWHQEDDYTITSRGHIWVYPGKPAGKNAVLVSRSLEDMEIVGDVYGICTDNPTEWVKNGH